MCAQVLVEQVRQLCIEERSSEIATEGRGYNALTQGPSEWGQEPGKPCSGERLLLMFDRWCARCAGRERATQAARIPRGQGFMETETHALCQRQSSASVIRSCELCKRVAGLSHVRWRTQIACACGPSPGAGASC